MNEKNAFLANIRKSLGFAEEETRTVNECAELFFPPDDTLVLERIEGRSHEEKQALLDILETNAEQLKLELHCVRDLEEAGNLIGELVKQSKPEFSGDKQVMLHDHRLLAKLQLWKQFAGQPVQVHTSFSIDGDVREKTIASYIGVTAPQWAVADSATIIEVAEEGRPRSTSLLPSVHIAVLPIDRLLADLSELYCLLRQNPPEESFVFISGPSKTADIEAHMVYGAHGPKDMHLIVIDEKMVIDTNFKGTGLFPGDD